MSINCFQRCNDFDVMRNGEVEAERIRKHSGNCHFENLKIFLKKQSNNLEKGKKRKIQEEITRFS